MERLNREYGWRISDFTKFRDGVWISERNDSLSYPNESRNILAAIEARSFWFLHRNSAIKRLLHSRQESRSIWEIGSGNGFVAWNLQQMGWEVVAVEPGLEGALCAAKRGVKNSISAMLQDLHLPDNSLPAVGLFDVVEHLENPRPLLKECLRVLKPGGIAAITVPAFPCLWSQADIDAGHFRRYRRFSLIQELEACGFKLLTSAYMMLSTWLPLWFFRTLPFKLGHQRPKEENLMVIASQLTPSRFASATLSALLAIEFSISNWLPLPIGTSVIGLFSKPMRST